MADPIEQTETSIEYQTTIADAGPAAKKINITVTAEQIAEKLEDSFDNLQAEAQLPGFRKGRAPLRLLEKRFGKDIRQEACNQIVGEAYSAAIESNDIRVLGEPNIKDAENLILPESGPLEIEIEVEVVPDFQLPELDNLEIKKPLFVADEDMINTEIDRYRETYGKIGSVTDAVQEQDYLTADVHFIDNDGNVLHHAHGTNIFVPGEKPNNYKGVVSGILVEDLGKQLTGKNLGDTIELKATGPKQHENEELREKEITIKIDITEIQRAEPLSVEQLVETAGFDSEDELREHFKNTLDQRAESEQRTAMAEQVTEALLEKIDIELPENLSAKQAQQILQRRAIELVQRGVPEQEIEQNLAELRASSEEQAAQQLKLLFILDAVARQLDIEISAEQVNGRVAMIAAQQQQRPEKVHQEMAKSGQLDQLYVQIREEASIAKLIENAKVTEISPEEWRKLRGVDEPEKPAASKSKKKSSKKKSTKKKTSSKKKSEDSED